MRRTSLILSLALVAALGIAAGLAWHVGSEWHDKRGFERDRQSQPGRFPLGQFINGTCGQEVLTLNEERLATHLETLGAELSLREDQADLIGQLILGRAQIGCELRQGRQDIRQAARSGPLGDPETARPFMEDVLNFRQALTEATLEETRIQRQLLDSFTDEQLSAVNGRNLPRLVPGLSLREVLGQAPQRPGGRDQPR